MILRKLYHISGLLYWLIFVFCLSFFLWFSTGCSRTPKAEVVPKPLFFDSKFIFDLEKDKQSWVGDFSGYVSRQKDSMKLLFEHTALPAAFNKKGNALRWSGFNYHNSLFMFGWRKISNLKPNSQYIISYDVRVGYQIEDGNEFMLRDYENKLHIKVGAVSFFPRTLQDEVLGKTIVNFDKGSQQSIDGRDMVWLGKMEAGKLSYKDKIARNGERRLFGVTTNTEGNFWALVGVESSIPLRHSVYIDKIVLYLKSQ